MSDGLPIDAPDHADGAAGEWFRNAIGDLLESSGLRDDERLHALAEVFVVEALRPYWRAGSAPSDTHDALRDADPELATALAGLAPLLVRRADVEAEARRLIASVEASLGYRR
jgi:hypothetical protein